MEEARTILVPVDNSEASEKALNWAVDWLFRKGDKLRLLHVIPLPTPQGLPLVMDMAIPAFPLEPDPQEDVRHIQEAKDFIRRRFGEKLDAKGVPYQATIVHFLTDNDSIGEAICKRAEAINASAVVMCKHQRGALKEFLLGSVAKYCTVHCKAPLVILH